MPSNLPSIDELVAGLNDLPSLPAAVADLIASLEDEDVDFDQLANKIQRDQGLAIKTLRVANSPFFGLAGKISSIQEATTIIGLSTIRSLALASAVGNIAGQTAKGTIDLHAFWLHAFETAIVARKLASIARVPTDHAFIAGLLHDVGKIALGVIRPDLLQKIEAYCTENNCGWHIAEVALGIPAHSEVGGALARRWHFPEPLCLAIAYNHPPIEPSNRLGQVIHVADVFAQAYAAATGRGAHLDPLSASAWEAVAATDSSLVSSAKALRSAADIALQMA